MPRPAWLAIGCVAGALTLSLVPAAATLLLGAALACAAVVARGARAAGAGRLAVVAVGVGLIGLRAVAAGPPVAAGLAPEGAGPWRATVTTVGPPRAGSRPATLTLELPDGTAPLVAATLPWYPAVVPGDRIEVAGRVRPPPEDDYGAYLERIGAVGTLRADRLERLGPEDGLGSALEGLRRLAAAGLDRTMPEPEAGLAAGVLIGLRDRVDRDLAAAFTTAGASHVVAISGWNIAIVASTLGALAGGMGRRRRAVLTVAAIVLYVAFVGPSASVVRAGVMAGVALLARELGRPGTAASALGLAVAGLLVLDPAWVDDAGFRLSVLATAGIIAWGTGLTSRLAGPAPSRPRRWVSEILGVSFAAQAATTPIVLLDFGRLSLVAPLVNLIVVPLVPPAMAAGALALVVGVLVESGMPGILATVVGLPAWGLYAAMVHVVRLGAGLPLASLELGPPWDLAAAAASGLVIVAAARWGDAVLRRLRPRAVAAARGPARRRDARGGRAPRLIVAALGVATVGLGLAVAYRPDGLARVTILDVGQGDGILVEGGRGGRMVVDGGPDPGRLLIALDERLPPWDRRIDILVLTHPHEDHVAGLALLLERYSVGRVYEPGMVGPGPGYEAWSEVLARDGPPHGRLTTGDRLTLDAIRFRVLWPDPNRVPADPPDDGASINNVSIVLLGEVGPQRFLLMGDVEEGVDPELLARGLPTVDLLKVAHHGSKTATTQAFLDSVRPRVAVASAGAGNPYGHPAPTTLERLAGVARETYRTDRGGTVQVAFTGQTLRVTVSGPRPTPRPRPTTARASPRRGIPGDLTASTQPAAPLAGALAWLCGIPSGAGPVIRPPTAPEAAAAPRVAFGPIASREAGDGLPRMGRIPEAANGARTGLAYHRGDGEDAGIRGRIAAGERSPRLLLGRRRVRHRRGDRGVPPGPGALPGRRAGALAPGSRQPRSRPPPG